MYVCLMRHGKAEPYHDGMDDKKRELIEKGKKQAAAMLDAARLWWPEGTTILWASPYIRTCQTAAFFDTRIPYTAFHTHPAIAAGDLDAVYKDILCRSDGDVVCIVGHSPYLEQWTKAWTGLDIQFKTGSMAFLCDIYGVKRVSIRFSSARKVPSLIACPHSPSQKRSCRT